MLDLLTWTSGGRKGEIASMYVLPASFPVSSPSSFPLVFPPPISSPSKRIMFCRCAANAESSFRAQTCSAPVQNVQSYSFFPLHLWMDVALWYLYCVQCCISVFMTRGAAHGRTGSLDLSLWRIYDGCHGGWPPPRYSGWQKMFWNENPKSVNLKMWIWCFYHRISGCCWGFFCVHKMSSITKKSYCLFFLFSFLTVFVTGQWLGLCEKMCPLCASTDSLYVYACCFDVHVLYACASANVNCLCSDLILLWGSFLENGVWN